MKMKEIKKGVNQDTIQIQLNNEKHYFVLISNNYWYIFNSDISSRKYTIELMKSVKSKITKQTPTCKKAAILQLAIKEVIK